MDCLTLLEPRYDVTPQQEASTAPRIDRYANWAEGVFKANLNRWQQESMIESDWDAVTQLDSFQRIVGLGGAAIPLILQELDHSPSLLVLALEDILGSGPLSDDMRGDVPRMIGAWKEWLQT